MYNKLSSDFVQAIKTIAAKPENLANLESYLNYHFDKWLEMWANTPEKITSELQAFANMEI